MKLTETQKNFRKQMDQVKVKYEEDIYDTTRKGNPFYNLKKESKLVKTILGAVFSVFLLFFLPMELYHFSTKPTSNLQKSSATPIASTQQTATSSQAIQTPITSQSTPLNKSVSRVDNAALDQLQSIRNTISESTAKLSEQHKIPWSKRDINTYKAVLLV